MEKYEARTEHNWPIVQNTMVVVKNLQLRSTSIIELSKAVYLINKFKSGFIKCLLWTLASMVLDTGDLDLLSKMGKI